MSCIKKIRARQILDSRGNPTVEVDLYTEDNIMGRGVVPSGASTGSREALELRDGDKNYYMGKSVKTAINNIHDIIAPKLVGKNIFDQTLIDKTMIELDGTEFKSRLGANAILAVSMANCRAAALHCGKPLYAYMAQNLKIPCGYDYGTMPTPLMNIVNGGAHASNNLDIQEFMIVPKLNKSFSENLRAGVEVFHALKSVLKQKGHATNVGDEGGFAPSLRSHEEALDFIGEAVQLAGFHLGSDIALALDCAASEFYQDGVYKMQGKSFETGELIDYYTSMVKNYPIYSIEDGLAEQDFHGHIELTKKLGNKILTVGDDLFVTNKKILEVGIKEKQANAILVKINQIGTLTETFETLDLAFKNNFKAIISHRSGETGDSFIADLAVASGAGHIKTGSASRSDRVEKYNQLLRIEEGFQENLQEGEGDKAVYRPVSLPS